MLRHSRREVPCWWPPRKPSDHHGSDESRLRSSFPPRPGGWCTTHVGTPNRGSTHACSTNHNASTAININAFSMSALLGVSTEQPPYPVLRPPTHGVRQRDLACLAA